MRASSLAISVETVLEFSPQTENDCLILGPEQPK
jgi:hypothetical protein